MRSIIPSYEQIPFSKRDRRLVKISILLLVIGGVLISASALLYFSPSYEKVAVAGENNIVKFRPLIVGGLATLGLVLFVLGFFKMPKVKYPPDKIIR